jgi:hypothetical protein
VDWNPDFRDLFCALNDARARYLVVGGYAVIFHTEPRFTKDLDVLVEPTRANAARVLRALAAFSAPIDAVTIEDIVDPDLVYQIGVAPNRVDVLSKISGVTFGSAWRRRVRATYADQRIWVLDAVSLRRAKRAAGRPQDLVDLASLSRRRRRGP